MRTKSGKKTPINQGTIDETLAGKSERGESITVKNEDLTEEPVPNLTPATATREERRGFRCGECRAEFPSADELERHEDHMHGKVLAETKSGRSTTL